MTLLYVLLVVALVTVSSASVMVFSYAYQSHRAHQQGLKEMIEGINERDPGLH